MPIMFAESKGIVLLYCRFSLFGRFKISFLDAFVLQTKAYLCSTNYDIEYYLRGLDLAISDTTVATSLIVQTK